MMTALAYEFDEDGPASKSCRPAGSRKPPGSIRQSPIWSHAHRNIRTHQRLTTNQVLVTARGHDAVTRSFHLSCRPTTSRYHLYCPICFLGLKPLPLLACALTDPWIINRFLFLW